MSRSKYLVIVPVLVGVILLGGWWLGYSQGQRENLRQELDRFSRILQVVIHSYVEEPLSTELIEASIDGMLNSLDPNSQLLDPEEHEELMVGTQGQFGGLGIQITIRDEILTVVSPLKDTPAERIGIQAGDRIVKIEEESTQGITLKDAVKKLRGDPGTKVTITIQREGLEDLADYTITREIIKIDNIPFYDILGDNVGYIALVNFSKGAGENLEDVIVELVDRGADKLIVDIRNNHGGLLKEAVRVTENFIPPGRTVVSTRGRVPISNKQFKSQNEPSYTENPLVILVNGGSASASEILAGAVQDWDRGLVMGDTTFGKGSVQTVYPLDYEYALKLTTAKYYTPSGRCIHKGEQLQVEADSGFSTLGSLKREITGGGGIVPDLVMVPELLNDFETELLRESIFAKFASRYTVAHPDLRRPVRVGPSVVGEFDDFLAEQEIEYSSEELEESTDFVLRRIDQEISLKLFGRDEAYRASIESDPLIRKAIELLSGADSFEELLEVAGQS
jgi:carboxyl-terminal processing protease